MKKLRAFLDKHGFFIMLALCVLLIGGSGFWALSVKTMQEEELAADSTADFVQKIEDVERYRMYRPVAGELQAEYHLIGWQETLGRWGSHEAVDFLAAKGESVFAAQAGYIAALYRDALWGGVVEISHGQDLLTRYCGLSWPMQIAVGQEVTAGEVIGMIGTAPVESMQPPHLHFEASIHGAPVDPMRYM